MWVRMWVQTTQRRIAKPYQCGEADALRHTRARARMEHHTQTTPRPRPRNSFLLQTCGSFHIVSGCENHRLDRPLFCPFSL